MQEIVNIIKTQSQKDDLILNMGAGDINNLWHKLESVKTQKNLIKTNLAA